MRNGTGPECISIKRFAKKYAFYWRLEMLWIQNVQTKEHLLLVVQKHSHQTTPACPVPTLLLPTHLPKVLTCRTLPAFSACRSDILQPPSIIRKPIPASNWRASGAGDRVPSLGDPCVCVWDQVVTQLSSDFKQLRLTPSWWADKNHQVCACGGSYGDHGNTEIHSQSFKRRWVKPQHK